MKKLAAIFATGKFDHPAGFFPLCLTEFGERVAFYGMQSILVLYLTQYLFVTKTPEDIWLVGAISEPLDLNGQALASTVVGGYMMVVSVVPLIGGLITDHLLGARRAVTIGGMAMAAGHLLLVYEPALIPALIAVALGSGLFRGAIASQFGGLYPAESKRFEAFQIFFIVINIAGLIAPLIVGTIGERVSWHFGFATASLAMAAAMVAYLTGMPKHRQAEQDLGASQPAVDPPTSDHWLFKSAIVVAVGLIAIPNLQLLNAYLIWANQNVDLQVTGYQLPTSWLIAIDAFLSLVVLTGSIPAWRMIERKVGTVGLTTRLSIASLFVCASALILVLAEAGQADAKVALIWPILFQLLNIVGLAQILPSVLALLGGKHNGKTSVTAISFYYFGRFVASLGSTVLAAQFATMEAWFFWALHLACALGGAFIFFGCTAYKSRQLVRPATLH